MLLGRYGPRLLFKRSCPIRKFTVLAFESSADDTCVAVVTSSHKILSNVVIKQNEYHVQHGGIQPAVAILAHQMNFPAATRRALAEARLTMNEIDGIAFTRGPGMSSCLAVGCNAAKTLAAALNKPLVGVHHMQAHALTPLLTSWPDVPQFPFLTLLVSGGHTLILLATSLTSFRILATTMDCAIGASFDKVARCLGLPWGDFGLGAALEKFCAEPEPEVHPEGLKPFGRPLRLYPRQKQLEFSFSSYHSHVERYINRAGGLEELDITARRGVAREFQRAIFWQIEDRLKLAVDLCRREQIDFRHLVVSGGVGSNMFLRERLVEALKEASPGKYIQPVFPPPALCTDNAVMVAWASMHRFLNGDTDDYEIAPRAKWSIEDLNIEEAPSLSVAQEV